MIARICPLFSAAALSLSCGAAAPEAAGNPSPASSQSEPSDAVGGGADEGSVAREDAGATTPSPSAEDANQGRGAGAGQGGSEEPLDGAGGEDVATAAAPELPAGTKVLHVGDSFAGALGRPLSTVFENAGLKSVLKHTDASYLTDWAWDGNLQKYIWKYNPDLVIVTLGANELEITDPQRREKTIKKIIATIGDLPCVWVAIPLWDGPKNGLLDVIKENAAPCVYMDTNKLFDTSKMARIQDGIHPTTAARAAWADDVALWLRKTRKPMEGRPWNMR